MGVEDLGLNVFIKGFKEFDNQMKAMDKSIDQIEEDWEDIDKASRKAAKGTDEATKATKKASKAQQILSGALRAVGEGIVGFVKDLPRMAVELAKAGAASLRQGKALDNLAKSAGTSGKEIVTAIQGASDFTIDKMTAMSAANKAMLLDVAKSPAQFEKLTKVAVSLGRAMGQDAAKSIDDFVTAAGRQSIMIADNLGLTIKMGEANEAYAKKLGISVNAMDSAQKKQAFLNAMLEAGEAKMADLGDGALDAAGSIERAEAKVSDLKTALGEKLAPALATVADILVEELTRTERITKAYDELTEKVKDTSTSYSQYVKRLIEAKEGGSRSEQQQAKQAKTMLAAGKSIEEVAKELGLMSKQAWNAEQATDDLEKSIGKAGMGMEDLSVQGSAVSDDIPEWKQRVLRLDAAYKNVIDDMDPLVRNLSFSEEAGWQAESAMVDLAESVDGLADSSVRAAEDNKELVGSLTEMGEAALGMGMTWKSYYDDVEESQKGFTERREEAELEHQENLAELQERARSKAVYLDAEAEETKLATLREKLDLALLQQSEFSEKTKESTRVAKQNQIDTLTEQIVEQETLLGTYYDGRLVTQGENITAELTAEEIRYQDELTLMEEQQTKQEEAQRQSLGRMVLQQFDAWATMKQIPADRMLEMRLAIASEYGLIDDDAVATTTAMIDTWEAWADDTTLSADRAISAFDNITLATADLKNSIDAIPRTIDIEARFTGPGVETTGAGFTFQRGSMFVPRTGLAMLHKGEAVLPQSIATVLRQSATNVTNNVTNQGAQNEFNFTAQSMMQPGQMQMEFSTMAMAMRNR